MGRFIYGDDGNGCVDASDFKRARFDLVETNEPFGYRGKETKAYICWAEDVAKLKKAIRDNNEPVLEWGPIATTWVPENRRTGQRGHEQRDSLRLLVHAVELAALARDACQTIENHGLRDPRDGGYPHPLVAAFNKLAQDAGLTEITGPSTRRQGWEPRASFRPPSPQESAPRPPGPAPVIPINRSKQDNDD